MNKLPRTNPMNHPIQTPPEVPPIPPTQTTEEQMDNEQYRQLMNYLLMELNKSIAEEASSINFYTRLAEVAPNELHQQNILHVLENEKEHLRLLTNLLLNLTGKQPVYEVKKITVSSYQEGLKIAYEKALKDYKSFRDLYLLVDHPAMRDIFLRAFTDEMEHANRFSMLRIERGQFTNNVNAKQGGTQTPSYSNNSGIKDYGPEPLVININRAANQNNNFRRALWTGNHLQVTLMSINPGEEIGLESHPTIDQFLRIEEGEGIVRIGNRQNQLNFEKNVTEDDAIMIPAGKWHNVTNTGSRPLKLYSIYAPPAHPSGTVHRTAEEAYHTEQHNHF